MCRLGCQSERGEDIVQPGLQCRGFTHREAVAPSNAGIARGQGAAGLNQDSLALLRLQLCQVFVECALRGRMHADNDARLMGEQSRHLLGETHQLGRAMASAKAGKPGGKAGQ